MSSSSSSLSRASTVLFLSAGFSAFLVLGCVASTEKQKKLGIGEVCTSPEQCVALDAVCMADGDLNSRCWSNSCTQDSDCGPAAVCSEVNEEEEEEEEHGTCYRTCQTAADCPKPASNSMWFCDAIRIGEDLVRVCKLTLTPTCGNGIKEFGEECDDGNYIDEDGCDSNCETEIGCGNGRLDVYVDDHGAVKVEECDDDNVTDGDGCSSDCKIEGPGPSCGNGILEMGEGCDPPEEGVCTQDCKRADGCGNNDMDLGEMCDDGNNVSGDGCSDRCLVEFICGNEVCEVESSETCELCPADCCPLCGNGELDEGEECDDGDNTGGDGCSQGCIDEDGVPTCGNGIWELGEECEDGNTDEKDGCSAGCRVEYVCGDEVCESDMGETCRRCPGDCCPQCGDGIRQMQYGELCDSQDLNGLTCQDFCFDGGSLGCTAYCEFDTSSCTGEGPFCGNNQAECMEQCDGTDLKGKSCTSLGYSSGQLGCDGNCNYDFSNCSGLVGYMSEGFEGTMTGWTLNGDWQTGTPSQSYEPSSTHGGTKCAGTVIGGYDSLYDTYDTCTMISPAVDLSAAISPVLAFYQYVRTENSYDGGNIWISDNDGASWTFMDNSFVEPDYYDDSVGSMWAYSGDKSSLGWHRVAVDLSGYKGQTIRVRFSYFSDSSGSYGGWYIDDVIVTEQQLLGPP